MPGNSLTGRKALVTGGSRGIGFHIAVALHAAAAEVAITGRRRETLDAAGGRIGERCRAYVCDQLDRDAIGKMTGAVLRDLGCPDILVNNAGLYRPGNVLDLSAADWDTIIGTNLTGVFLTTKAFLPSMIEKGRGDIFMISSMSGKKGDPGAGAYAASKFGLQGFSQALMHEVRRHNIRVMVLNPSSVDTGEDKGPESGPGLHLHAADIAATIVHLAGLPGRTMFRDMEIWGTNPFR